jgi:hypothetical protein
MRKVYVLIKHRTAGRIVRGVFSTKRAAQSRVNALLKVEGAGARSRYEICEEDVDAPRGILTSDR